jgi:hypothetical protein
MPIRSFYVTSNTPTTAQFWKALQECQEVLSLGIKATNFDIAALKISNSSVWYHPDGHDHAESSAAGSRLEEWRSIQKRNMDLNTLRVAWGNLYGERLRDGDNWHTAIVPLTSVITVDCYTSPYIGHTEIAYLSTVVPLFDTPNFGGTHWPTAPAGLREVMVCPGGGTNQDNSPLLSYGVSKNWASNADNKYYVWAKCASALYVEFQVVLLVEMS